MFSACTTLSIVALGVVIYSSIRVKLDVRNLRVMLDSYPEQTPDDLFKAT